MRFGYAAIIPVLALSAGAATFDDIGLTALRQRQGALLANGAGVTVAQVEAAELGAYTPNVNNGDFTGKTFTFFGIGEQPVSAHATGIAEDIYGSSAGVAPKVKKMLLFSNDTFINTQALGVGAPVSPAKLGAQVINNSWVGNLDTNAANNDALRRLDYMIVRDNVVVANGLDNTNTPPMRVLLAGAYNGLNAGIAPGSGNTFTTQTTSGFHLMPDIIVPVNTTSQATAYVAGSAALLISEAKAHKKPVTGLGVRASLLAGAQRLSGWQHAPGMSLDAVQGAGQLRVDHSFDILMGGEIAPAAKARTRGWDSDVVQAKEKLFYNITLTRPASHFSAALIWNRRISQAPVPFPSRTVTLANLDLQLQRKKGDIWVDAGRSFYTGDNVEFIARENLIAGTYRLLVTGDRAETFSVAWYTDFTLPPNQIVPGLAAAHSLPASSSAGSSVVPEPLVLMAPLFLAVLAMRRRARRLGSE